MKSKKLTGRNHLSVIQIKTNMKKHKTRLEKCRGRIVVCLILRNVETMTRTEMKMILSNHRREMDRIHSRTSMPMICFRKCSSRCFKINRANSSTWVEEVEEVEIQLLIY
jgi:hypothetical protein